MNMIFAKSWVRGAFAVAALTAACGAHAAIDYTNLNNPSGGYAIDVPSGGYANVGGTSLATVSANYAIPDFMTSTAQYNISSALLTIFLADDSDQATEYAGFKSGSVDLKGSAYVPTAQQLSSLSTIGLNVTAQATHRQPNSTGTFEVDGAACYINNTVYFLTTNSACRTSYYDAYVFDVTSLVKEGQAFNMSVFATDTNLGNTKSNDTANDFWYKGSYLSITTTKVKVPEPATLGLLGLGLLGIGFTRRLRMQA